MKRFMSIVAGTCGALSLFGSVAQGVTSIGSASANASAWKEIQVPYVGWWGLNQSWSYPDFGSPISYLFADTFPDDTPNSADAYVTWTIDDWRDPYPKGTISAYGSAFYRRQLPGYDAYADTWFRVSFTTDRDGIFEFKTTGDGTISLSGAVVLTVSGEQTKRGVLPAGSYSLDARATQGSFSFFVPAAPSLVMLGVGLLGLAARRRR